MKKSYWIAPLIALLVFAAGYGQFRRAEHAREQARSAQRQADRQAQLSAETEARRQAVVEAVRLQANRQKAREEREADERCRQDSRQQDLATRDRSLHEQQTLTRQLAAIKSELATEQAAHAQLTATRRGALTEQVFLKQFLMQAEANVKALAEVIAKLPPAESIRLPNTAAPAANKKS